MKCAEASLHPAVSSQNCFFFQSSVNSGWRWFFCSCASFLWLFQTSAWLSLRTSRVSWLAPPHYSAGSTPLSILSVTHQSQADVEFLSFPVLFWNAATHFSWIYLQTLFCFTPCFYHTFVQSVSQVFQYLLHSPTYHFVSSHFTVNPIIDHFLLLLAALLFPKDLYLIKNATKGSNNTVMERWSLL